MFPSKAKLLTTLMIVVSVMANNLLPIKGSFRKGSNPVVRIWVTYAMQDSTPFLATLSFAAVHLDVATRRYTSPRALSYKILVIQMVNVRLGSSGNVISDTTIGAVAMLTALEVSIHVSAYSPIVHAGEIRCSQQMMEYQWKLQGLEDSHRRSSQNDQPTRWHRFSRMRKRTADVHHMVTKSFSTALRLY